MMKNTRYTYTTNATGVRDTKRNRHSIFSYFSLLVAIVFVFFHLMPVSWFAHAQEAVGSGTQSSGSQVIQVQDMPASNTSGTSDTSANDQNTTPASTPTSDSSANPNATATSTSSSNASGVVNTGAINNTNTTTNTGVVNTGATTDGNNNNTDTNNNDTTNGTGISDNTNDTNNSTVVATGTSSSGVLLTGVNQTYTGSLLTGGIDNGTGVQLTTGDNISNTTQSGNVQGENNQDAQNTQTGQNTDDLTIAEIEAASPPPPVSDEKMDLVIFDEENYIEEFDNTLEATRIPPQIEDSAFFQIEPEDIIDEYTAQGGKVHVTTTSKGTFLRVKLK